MAAEAVHDRDHGGPSVIRAREHVQHVLHPGDVLPVQRGDAPHFFPATASARGGQARGAPSRGRHRPRSRAASLPRSSAESSSGRSRREAGHTPTRQWLPAAACPVASAASAVGRRSVLRPDPAPATASRPVALRADTCPPPAPRRSATAPDAGAPGCECAATGAPRAAGRRPSRWPRHVDRPRAGAAPGSGDVGQGKACIGLDHIHRSGASQITALWSRH